MILVITYLISHCMSINVQIQNYIMINIKWQIFTFILKTILLKSSIIEYVLNTDFWNVC